MAEYVDKEIAMMVHKPPKSQRCYQTDNLDDAYGQGWDDALNAIEKLQTANVKETIYAHWIEEKEHIYFVNGTCKEWINFYCSKCDVPSPAPTQYCPNCGAEMSEVK